MGALHIDQLIGSDQIADCRLQIADYGLQTSDYPLQTLVGSPEGAVQMCPSTLSEEYSLDSKGKRYSAAQPLLTATMSHSHGNQVT